MTNTLKNELFELAESVLEGTDFFLIDVAIKGNRPPEVWVYADGSDRGLDMDECAEISRELGFLIYDHELFSDDYRLNISSPGMKQALEDKQQFPKNKGRRIKLKFKNNDEYINCEGVLDGYSDHDILIQPDDEEALHVPFNQIVEAKVIPSFK